MKTAFGIVFACALLGGCTEAQWSDSLNSIGMGDEPVQHMPVATQPAPPLPWQVKMPAEDQKDFCENIARQAVEGNGYDPATRQRVYQARLSQCQAMISDQRADPRQASTQLLSVPAETETR